MKTAQLIRNIKFNELLSKEVCEEIIQQLYQFDELKKVIHDTVDNAIELYSFLFSVTGEFE